MATKNTSFAQYFYRMNPDKTTDSICGYCFLTVATAFTQGELRQVEASHHCSHTRIPAGVLAAQSNRRQRKV